MSDNTLPFPGKGHERQPKLNNLQRESAISRWPVRHAAALRGQDSLNKLFPNIVSLERDDTMGAKVVSIASRPDYQYYSDVAPAPSVDTLTSETDSQLLDANDIRSRIDGIYNDQTAA
jgi:hypothetical protein